MSEQWRLICCLAFSLSFLATSSVGQQNNSTNDKTEKCSQPIYKSSEVTRKAKITHADDPDYTKEAYGHGVKGKVVLRMVLCSTGKVTDVEVIKGLAYGLTENAIETTRKMKFRPAEKDGHPVSITILREFSFNP